MPPGSGGGRPQRPSMGDDEQHSYQVTLEELYKGKTAKFASTKNVICSHCKGSGGKEKAKPKQCSSCEGRGALEHHIGRSFAELIENHRCQASLKGRRTRYGYSRHSDMQFMQGQGLCLQSERQVQKV